MVDNLHLRFESYLNLLNTKNTNHIKINKDEATNLCVDLSMHIEKTWDVAVELYRKQNYPLSNFLSILVIEEIGKLVPLFRDLGKSSEIHFSVQRKHKLKHLVPIYRGVLINSRLMRVLGKNKIEAIISSAENEDIEKIRQKCLYIDTHDNKLNIPKIPKQQALEYLILSGELMLEIIGDALGFDSFRHKLDQLENDKFNSL